MASESKSGIETVRIIKKNKEGVLWADIPVDRIQENRIQDIDYGAVYSSGSISEFINAQGDFDKLSDGVVPYLIYLDGDSKSDDVFLSQIVSAIRSRKQAVDLKHAFYLIESLGGGDSEKILIDDSYYSSIFHAHGVTQFSMLNNKDPLNVDWFDSGPTNNLHPVLNVLYFYHSQSIIPDIIDTPSIHFENDQVFIDEQLHSRDQVFDYQRFHDGVEKDFSHWQDLDFIKLTANLIAIEKLLAKDQEENEAPAYANNIRASMSRDLVNSLHYTYSLLSDSYIGYKNKLKNRELESLHSELKYALHDFFESVYGFSTNITESYVHQSGFTQSPLFNEIQGSLNASLSSLNGHNSGSIVNKYVSADKQEEDEETEAKPLYARWLRAGQRNFSTTGSWLRQIGGDVIGRIGQELANSLSLIQVLGFIQTKHYYELSGELTDAEKLDIQLQQVQLASLIDTPIIWTIDTIRYFQASTKVMTVRFLSSLSDVISKAFFVFGAFFGVAVDAYSIVVSVNLLKKINEPRAREGVIFGLITSIFGFIISLVTTIVIIGYVVVAVAASVAAAGASVAAVVSGVLAGISSATAAIGPVGLAIAAVMMLVSGLYSAITTVRRYKEKINLSVEDTAHLGARSFFLGIIPVADNFAPPSIENEYQKVISNERFSQFYLDFRESYYTRLIESLAYGSEKLFRIVFSIDGFELEVEETYKRGQENGYETYKPKAVGRNTVVNFDTYNFNNLTKNANKKNVKDYQPDFPLPKLSDTLDPYQALYSMKFQGFRSLTRGPNGALVNANPKDDIYKHSGDNARRPTHIGDFNGDGQSDIVRFMDRGIHVNFNNGGFFNSWTHLYEGFSIYRGRYNTQNEHPRLVGDFNGDGFDDIVGFQNKHVEVLINRRLKMYPESESNIYKGFGGYSVLKFPSPTDSPKAGDTQDEPLKTTSSPDNNITSIFTNDSGYKEQKSSPRLVGDFNCDSKDDIIGFTNETMVQAYSTTGINSFEAEFDLSDQTRFSIFHDQSWSQDNVFVGDFNGDGCSDLVGLKPGSMIATFGSKLGDEEVNGAYQGSKYNEYMKDSYKKIVLDITNDKMDDILFIKEGGSFGSLISQGDGTFKTYDSKEGWFTFPKKKSSVGGQDPDYLYFNITERTSEYIGRDHDNAVYAHRSNGEIVRYILGPDTFNSEDGVLAIELGDGDDEARGLRSRANHFYVGEGRKHFIGGEKNDTFILNTDKVPDLPSILDGGPEALQPSSFRQPPMFEPLKTLTAHEENLNQNDYFVGNIIYISPDDVEIGKAPGFEVNLHQSGGYVKYRGSDKQIARLKNIEHATGHSFTGDHLIGDEGFNVLDGLGSIDEKNSDLLEAGYGDDLLILHHNTFAYGGPGDDRYIFKASEYSSLITIADTEGDNSVILSTDFEQIAQVGISTAPGDLVMYLQNDNETTTFLVLEKLLNNIEAVDRLNFSTRDGFSLTFDGEESASQNFHFGFVMSYSPSKDMKYAADITSSEGKIKIIQDLYHKKIQVIEMDKDLKKVVRVIRDIVVPDYCTHKPSSSDFHDEIHGTTGNDLLNGGKGNDRLVGRGGADFYVVTTSESIELSGETRINNFDPSPVDKLATDIVRVDLSYDEIKLVKSGSDLLIKDDSNNAQRQKDIIIEDFFVSESYRHLLLSERNDYTHPVLINEKNQPFLAPAIVKGTESHDEKPDEEGYVKKLIGHPYTRVTLFGLDGNDILRAKAAHEDKNSAGVFDPSNKGDILLGGKGSDILIDSVGMDILKGEEGNDLIISTLGNDLIEPGSGIDHVIFLPGARGLKTYLIPADLKGELEKGRSNKIMVPYDIDDAIYQRIGDDLQIIMLNDYEPISTTDISDKVFEEIMEKALIIHCKDFFKSLYFRKFRLATYDKESLKEATGINRNLPGSLEILKQKDGADLLRSYRDKSKQNKNEKSANIFDLESGGQEVTLLQPVHWVDDDSEVIKVKEAVPRIQNSVTLSAGRGMDLLVQAAASMPCGNTVAACHDALHFASDRTFNVLSHG